MRHFRAGLSITSLIAPLALLSKSILYYFLLSFLVPLTGMLLFRYYAGHAKTGFQRSCTSSANASGRALICLAFKLSVVVLFVFWCLRNVY